MKVPENSVSFFDNKDLYVGIDVHKKRWVVTIRTYDLELKTFSMQPYAEELERFLIENYKGAHFHIVYECCFSGFWIYDHFHEKGYDIIVTPTNRIYRDGSIVKTDKIDSRKLAFQHSRGLLREVKVPTMKIREYRSLFRIYDKEKMREGQILRQVRCILECKNHELKWEKWNKAMIEKLKEVRFQEGIFNQKFVSLLKEYEYVKEQIKDTEKRIKEISEDEELGVKVKRIEKINGIGIVSAVRFAVYLFDQKMRFESGEKLVHYVGLTPGEQSSGENIIRSRTGLIGNRQLRSIIIQLAWVAVRKDGSLLNKFERVYKNSGSKQKAIVAVARKLMMKVYAITEKEEEYEINKAA
ncbi:MAG: IS110 family transposase [Bacteroidetes bacterium]|nr:IS110 family transposase [Bacteroidota bacterium]MBU1421872.1 IS110 family transposase [Bacteroidota bacterium]MBU2471484.1 IS110 family transposase [Bacteroidota bacterium]MBU2636785.1 IS110 family transposase [Bacteroidota bacterium]